MAKYLTAKNLSLLYNVAGMLPFGLMSADMVTEVWPSVVRESCGKGGWGSSGKCTDSLEFTVGKIYLQVMFGVALMYSSMIFFSGKTAYLGAMGAFAATQAKHITVDGLIPPPPVMAMTAGVTLAILFAPKPWGRYAFIAMCFLNAFTFLSQPLMVLQDSFPDVVEGSKEAKLGAFCMEVIALYMAMAGVEALVPIKKYSLALSSQMGAAVIAKHVLINKSGPPTPMIALWTVTTILAWLDYGTTKMKPAADKAIKDGPMKLHGIVVGTGFVPYFVAEALGFPFPMVGLAEIDSSYSYGGATSMLTAMLAIFCAMTAWTEYTGKLDGWLFAVYHYFLSPVVFFWQVQPTTSTLGALFFAAPHMFTLWTCYCVIANSPKDKEA